MKRAAVTLVAIAGGSGSGKTWLARRLQRALGTGAALVSLDDFYRDLSHLPPAQRRRVNFDSPAAIDWPTVQAFLKALQRSEPTVLPRYDFTTHTRLAPPRRWRPRRIILLEGLWPLRTVELRRLYGFSIFVACPEELRLERRLRRDQQERGRSRASVLRQFRDQVAPMHRRFVEPQARHADVVLRHPPTTVTVRELAEQIRLIAYE